MCVLRVERHKNKKKLIFPALRFNVVQLCLRLVIYFICAYICIHVLFYFLWYVPGEVEADEAGMPSALGFIHVYLCAESTPAFYGPNKPVHRAIK